MARNANIGIKQIAEAAGVAPSTVSLVLNNKGSEIRIAPATQEKIRRIANDLQYQPVKRAKSAPKKKTPVIIGTFWPMDFEKGPITPFFHGALRYIEEHHLSYETVMIPFKQGRLSEKQQMITGEYLTAAVMMGIADDDLDFIQESRIGLPIVTFNREAHNCHCVTIDDYDVGKFACKHFLKRNHKRLSIIAPNYASKALSLRSVGFSDGVRSASPNTVIASPHVFQGENSDVGGYHAAALMLREPNIPTALFVANDIMMPGVIRRIEEEGKKTPEDIEIISFGNNKVSRLINPNITSFDLPIAEMASDCIQILQRDLDGTIDMRISRNYTAKCIFRESCPQEGVFRE